MTQSQNLTLSFSSESSIEEELKRESTADVITILVSSFLEINFCIVQLNFYSLSLFMVIFSRYLHCTFYFILFYLVWRSLSIMPIFLLIVYSPCLRNLSADKLSCDVCLHISYFG